MDDITVPVTITLQLPLSVIKDYLPLLCKATMETDNDVNDLLQMVKNKKEDGNIHDMVNAPEVAPPAQPSTLDVIKNMNDDDFEEILSKTGFKEADAATARRLREEVKSGKPLDLAAVTQLVTAYKQDNQLDLSQLSSLLRSFQPSKQETVVEKQPVQPTPSSTSSTPSTTPSTTPPAPSFDLNQMMSAFAPMLSNLTQQRGGGRGKRYNKRR